MFKDKNVFVAGGRTGFIGTNFVKELLNRGAFVYAHSLNRNKKSNFLPQTENLIELVGDLSESIHFPNNIEYVFHCAAHTSGAYEMINDPVAQITTNVFMNSRLMEIAAKSGVKKFVFISSSAVYPDSDFPLKEEEGLQNDPPDCYFGPAWMKRYSEKLGEFFSKKYNMSVLIIRPSNIYGPYSGFDLNYSHVLPALIRKFVEKLNPLEVWGSPDVVRDFIYIDDFIEGVLKAFEKEAVFDIYNIASGSLTTIGEATKIIKSITNYDGKVIFNADKPVTIFKRVLDTTKAQNILNFTAKTSMENGLEKTIEWYKQSI